MKNNNKKVNEIIVKCPHCGELLLVIKQKESSLEYQYEGFIYYDGDSIPLEIQPSSFSYSASMMQGTCQKCNGLYAEIELNVLDKIIEDVEVLLADIEAIDDIAKESFLMKGEDELILSYQINYSGVFLLGNKCNVTSYHMGPFKLDNSLETKVGVCSSHNTNEQKKVWTWASSVCEEILSAYRGD